MTALCGGGPSGPQSGVQNVIKISAIAVEAFISSVLAMPEIAPILAPIIAAAVDIDLTLYCSTDPPADPGLTAVDVAEAIAFPATGQTIAAQQKVVAWFKHRYWWQICQCTSTTTPAPPAQSNPGNTSTNPGLPQPTSSSCWEATVPFHVGARPTSTSFESADLTSLALPAQLTSTTTTIQTGVVRTIQTVPLSAGFINARLQTKLDVAVQNNTSTVFFRVAGFNSSGAAFGDTLDDEYFHGTGNTSPGSLLFSATMPTTPVTWGVWIENTDTIDHSGSLTLTFQCAPGASSNQPCCPPDPLLEQYLSQILALDTAIYEALPIPVTSFAEGAVHAGLTSLGTISLATSAIAVKLTLTTIPAWVGSDVLSDPTYYFDVGFLGFETSEGTYAQQRIQHTPQVFTVPVLGYTVAYSLKNGVVASITELTRGP